ncbi:hypothetical protein BTUL_0040g00460 [Botrytis tulipae]|uniref:Uncharacterized protein n=1 Tax=Botrytis tulipae TaxID=87230 RepID=A0A4Z1EWI9_9HELO|nr:hypothetical protein BTUL_0040g00460 [Botrytis tulipae]
MACLSCGFRHCVVVNGVFQIALDISQLQDVGKDLRIRLEFLVVVDSNLNRARELRRTTHTDTLPQRLTPPLIFSQVISILEPFNHSRITIAMLFTDDITTIRNDVQQEIDAGKEIILCGAVSMTSALGEMSITERI